MRSKLFLVFALITLGLLVWGFYAGSTDLLLPRALRMGDAALLSG
jgi:hypothetical protein